MLFTSINFFYFISLIFILYWIILKKSLKGQNYLLLIGGYFFYGWWDWRFLFLLIFISIFNFYISLLIQKDHKQDYRKIFFLIALIINLGTLFTFKYLNFFLDGFTNIFSVFGFKLDNVTLNILLPLGLSFYIFISLSYIIDVYRNNLIVKNKDFSDVLLSLSFFPIILAGPIQRPRTLLPQIQKKREFNYTQAVNGLRQILWGLFMKIVIADNCSVFVDTILKNYFDYKGSTLLLAAFMFTVQIYADFAGYSNIAIGIGKLLGFDIMKNFAFPYFSRDLGIFWKRWNISLTTWFRDFLFLPIAYSLTRKIKTKRFFYIYYLHSYSMDINRTLAWCKLYIHCLGTYARVFPDFVTHNSEY